MTREPSIQELRAAIDAAEARMTARFEAGVPLRQLRAEERLSWWNQHAILVRRMGEVRYRQTVRRHVLERARRAALTRGQRPWTAAEDAIVRARYRRVRAAAIAERLDRSVPSVCNRAAVLGVSRPSVRSDPGFEAFVIARHTEGWSDAEIAAAHGRCDRVSVGRVRRRHGLPVNTFNARHRARVAAKTRQQCRAAGVANLGQLRGKVLSERAEAMGWPAGLLYRQGQILAAIWQRGPMTRQQLAEAVGMPWKGSRQSLTGNCPGGSYLADLMRRGLVIDLGRCVGGRGKGGNVHMYSLPLWLERNPDVQQAERGHAATG